MKTLLPKVSIITPSYNQGQFIEDTIQSVLRQTYCNIEYIIIDGGSNDQTIDVFNKYNNRINAIIIENDNGQTDAINKGFKLATGELIGWINSDDILYPNCIEKIVNTYLLKPEGAIYYGSTCDWIDQKGNIAGKRQLPVSSKGDLLLNNYEIIQQGSFYSAKLVRHIGYLNESLHYCMDLDLWLRLLNYGPIFTIAGEPVAAFRKWEETKTATGGVKFLGEIRNVLLANGAPVYAKTILKTYYYSLKLFVKSKIYQIWMYYI